MEKREQTQKHHCVRKYHYISLPLLFKADPPHAVNTFKVMFLYQLWGQVSTIINQLPGWYYIVYYCWILLTIARHLKPLIHEECWCVSQWWIWSLPCPPYLCICPSALWLVVLLLLIFLTTSTVSQINDRRCNMDLIKTWIKVEQI